MNPSSLAASVALAMMGTALGALADETMPVYPSFLDVVTSASTEAETMASGYLEDSVEDYTPPQVAAESDLATLWEELANEASFMKAMLGEGRPYDECIRACDRATNINRGRCRQNCRQADDRGCSGSYSNMRCDDCSRCFPSGNRRRRCEDSCRQASRSCRNARSITQCYENCASKSDELDNCKRRQVGGNGTCRGARNSSDCRRFCDTSRERKDCIDRVTGGGGKNGSCRYPRRSSDCKMCRGYDCCISYSDRERCLDIVDGGGSVNDRCRNPSRRTDCSRCRTRSDRERCNDRLDNGGGGGSRSCSRATSRSSCRKNCDTSRERNRCYDRVDGRNGGGSGSCSSPRRRSDCKDCRTRSARRKCEEKFGEGGQEEGEDKMDEDAAKTEDHDAEDVEKEEDAVADASGDDSKEKEDTDGQDRANSTDQDAGTDAIE